MIKECNECNQAAGSKDLDLASVESPALDSSSSANECVPGSVQFSSARIIAPTNITCAGAPGAAAINDNHQKEDRLHGLYPEEGLNIQ